MYVFVRSLFIILFIYLSHVNLLFYPFISSKLVEEERDQLLKVKRAGEQRIYILYMLILHYRAVCYTIAIIVIMSIFIDCLFVCVEWN